MLDQTLSVGVGGTIGGGPGLGWCGTARCGGGWMELAGWSAVAVGFWNYIISFVLMRCRADEGLALSNLPTDFAHCNLLTERVQYREVQRVCLKVILLE